MVSRSEPVPLFRLSTAELGGAAALAGFQESVHDLFDACPDSIVSAEDVHADLAVAHLGNLLLSEVRATAKRFERDRRRVALSGLDHVLVQLYSDGGYAGLAGQHDIRVRPGDICFLDLTRTLSTRAADFRNVSVVVPRPLMEAAVGNLDGLHGRVLDGNRPNTRLLAQHLETLLSLSDKMSLADGEAAAEATVAMIARLAGEGAAPGSAEVEPSLFQRVLEYVDRHIGDETLGPAQIAAVLGVSRTSLYRLFDQFGGIAAMIRLRRLNGAALELCAPRPPRVAQVARRWGFADASAFSRAFRSHFGIPPREARSHGSELRRRVLLSEDNSGQGRQVALWLRTLR